MSALEFGQYCLVVRTPQANGEIHEICRAVLWVTDAALKINTHPNDEIFYAAKVSIFNQNGGQYLRFDVEVINNGAAVIFRDGDTWRLGFVDKNNDITVLGKLLLSPELASILEYLQQMATTSTV